MRTRVRGVSVYDLGIAYGVPIMRKTCPQALDGEWGWNDFQGEWVLSNRLQKDKFVDELFAGSRRRVKKTGDEIAPSHEDGFIFARIQTGSDTVEEKPRSEPGFVVLDLWSGFSHFRWTA